MPLYLQIAQREQAQDKPYISCTRIAEECHLDAILVRKDIASTGVVGLARCGFNIDQLIDAIETFLGWQSENEAFLVGAGNLGSAITKYKQFRDHGLMIVAAFDIDEDKVGTSIETIPIFSMAKLPDLAKRMRVPIGIITVPTEVAQDVANMMVAAGFKALWNFSPIVLQAPAEIVVENVLLSASLGVLTSKLKQQSLHGGVEKKQIKRKKETMRKG